MSFFVAANTSTWIHLFVLCLTPQGGVLPAAHRRPCLHRGRLRGQRSTDRLLRPHREELCHSECRERPHTLNETRLCPSESADRRRHCLLSPVLKRSHGGHVRMNRAANCLQPRYSTDSDLGISGFYFIFICFISFHCSLAKTRVDHIKSLLPYTKSPQMRTLKIIVETEKLMKFLQLNFDFCVCYCNKHRDAPIYWPNIGICQ